MRYQQSASHTPGGHWWQPAGRAVENRTAHRVHRPRVVVSRDPHPVNDPRHGGSRTVGTGAAAASGRVRWPTTEPATVLTPVERAIVRALADEINRFNVQTTGVDDDPFVRMRRP